MRYSRSFLYFYIVLSALQQIVVIGVNFLCAVQQIVLKEVNFIQCVTADHSDSGRLY